MRHATNAPPSPAELDKAIAVAMRGMQELRQENARLRARNNELEHRSPDLEREIVSLKAQLDSERNERRHYYSLANELVTRIDVVVRTVGDVVQRAQHGVQSMRKEYPCAEVTELKIPAYLNQPILTYPRGEPTAEKPQD
jgi:hypothetical protein